jgi:pyruvate carboxylase
VAALRAEFDLPVHLHTHDTAGGQLATLLAAIDVGVDAVDVASAPLAGTASQPSMSSLIAATDHTPRATGLSLSAVCDLEPYWETTRRLYAPFESGLPSPTGRVYTHEIPGGQLSNLRQQAVALGLGEKFEQIEDMYAAANTILGNIVKVTPSSKVVGDLALHLVAVGADPADFAENPGGYDVPDSVLGFLAGELGDPPGGWPEPFRTRALAGRTRPPPTLELSVDQRDRLAADPRGALNELLFPEPTRIFTESRERFGDLTGLPTLAFLHGLSPDEEYAVELEEGKTLLLGLQSVGAPDARGIRTAICTINGQLRPVPVRDLSVAVDVPDREKADPTVPGQVGVPYSGVVTVAVNPGDTVSEGDVVASIEAMKMEASVTAPVSGVIERVAIRSTQQVLGGDLVLVIS